MLLNGHYVSEGDTTRFNAVCTHCHKPIGGLTVSEVQALLTGLYGEPVCFDCQDWFDSLVNPIWPEKWPTNEQIVLTPKGNRLAID